MGLIAPATRWHLKKESASPAFWPPTFSIRWRAALYKGFNTLSMQRQDYLAHCRIAGSNRWNMTLNARQTIGTRNVYFLGRIGKAEKAALMAQ